MVTIRKAGVDKATKVNLDTIMKEAVQDEPLVAQAAQTEGERTFDSDYHNEEPVSRQDRVST